MPVNLEIVSPGEAAAVAAGGHGGDPGRAKATWACCEGHAPMIVHAARRDHRAV